MNNYEISETYASTIVEVRVSFIFCEFDCKPSAITDAIELKPDRVLIENEQRMLRSGILVTNKYNLWMLNSRIESKDVNEHIRELLVRLLPKQDDICARWNPSFEVVWKGNYLYAGSGPFYEKDVIEGVAALGAELWQDIYQTDENDESV